jgi:4-diphosphocytidyl-2-C-methyl-D-erythritol kinase
VLRALTALFPGALAAERLAALALGLGADVPFFLDPRPAIVRGIGERIAPVGSLPPLHFVLAHPGLPLATADVYRAFDQAAPALTLSDPGSTLPPPFGFLEDGAGRIDRVAVDRIAGLVALLGNDLEPAAIRLCPPVARLREQVRTQGALAAGMSGSGPTVFGLFEDAAAAGKAARTLALEPPAWSKAVALWSAASEA